MHPASRILALLGTATLFLTIAVPRTIAQSTPATTSIERPLAVKPDLSLLTQATANFLKGNGAQTESMTEIVGNSRSSNFKLQLRSTTIVQAPDRFRAEISLASTTKQTATRSTLVISDGRTVWIYRPDLKQYMKMTYAQFDRRNDSFSVGMSSLLYLVIAPQLKPLADQGALSDRTVQQQLNALTTADLKGGSRTVNGENSFVYEYSDRQNRYSYSAVIHPVGAVLKQIQLKGNVEGLNLTMTETIQRRQSNPPITIDMFRFSPPKDVKEVKTIEIMPL